MLYSSNYQSSRPKSGKSWFLKFEAGIFTVAGHAEGGITRNRTGGVEPQPRVSSSEYQPPARSEIGKIMFFHITKTQTFRFRFRFLNTLITCENSCVGT